MLSTQLAMVGLAEASPISHRGCKSAPIGGFTPYAEAAAVRIRPVLLFVLEASPLSGRGRGRGPRERRARHNGLHLHAKPETGPCIVIYKMCDE